MRKLIFILIPLVIFSLVIFFSYRFFFTHKNEKGALQVTATPQSKVYLNGTLIGETPLCKCEQQDMLSVGGYTVKLVPKEGKYSDFQEKIKIERSVLTVVDRRFGSGGNAVLGASSEGSIISLSPLKDSKSVELLVLTIPDKVDISLDNVPVGTSPLLLKNITISDHTLKLQKSGYKEKTVRIRTPMGYKLTANIYLGIDDIAEEPTPTASAAASPTPAKQMIVILQTPTGFLRVRSGSTVNASEVARVAPGQTYELISEKTDWYEIKLDNGKSGWVSTQYTKKQ